jgi:hypothetical protein
MKKNVQLTKAEQTIVRVETAAAVAMFVVILVLVKAIIDGSMWAVIGVTIPALAMSLLLEDADRIREGAKRKNKNDERK